MPVADQKKSPSHLPALPVIHTRPTGDRASDEG